MRIIGLLFLTCMLVTIAVVFEFKHDTEQAADEVAELHRRIDEEKYKISLLRAEYSALVQPERMQWFVERFPEQLNLVPLSVDHLVNFEDLPVKPVEIEQLIDGGSIDPFVNENQEY